MKLLWSPQAIQDLADVRAYIAAHDPTASKRVVARILALVRDQLTANPESGRLGRVAGTRELVITRTPFVVPYRIRAEGIDILRVYHAARMWPGSL